MINKTLGTGGDYATWTALRNALNTATLLDDWTVTLISDITMSALVDLPALNLAGFKLRITQATAVLGNPGVGYKINSVYGVDFDYGVMYWGGTSLVGIRGGTIQFDNLIFDGEAGQPLVLTKGFSACDILLFDILFRNTGGNGCLSCDPSTGNVTGGVRPTLRAFNLAGAVYNAIEPTPVFYTSSNPSGLSADLSFENCSAYSDYGDGAWGPVGAGGSRLTLANCYATSWGMTSATMLNSSAADSSAYGTGAVDGVTPSAAFDSVAWDANFLKVKSGSAIESAGAAPSVAENDFGIRGNARPTGNGTVSIGSDQADIAASVSGGIMPSFVPGI